MNSGKLCSIEGCDKPAKARGWCAAHWWRWRNHGDPLKLADPVEKPDRCEVEGCSNPPNGRRGMCVAHYLRLRRHGDVSIRLRVANGDSLRWLQDHVDFDGEGCLTWPYGRGTDGRGMMGKVFGTPQAHRVMCFLVNGPPPSDIHEAAHSCGKGHEACVHPKHLRWATPSENCQEKKDHGTEVLGEDRWNHVLTEDAVKHIRSADMPISWFAALYGVDPETVRDAKKGKTWAWL